MRTMYDSTNIHDIPKTAQMVGYYTDGLYAVPQAVVRSRFPSATLVSISAIGTNSAVVGDVEIGCIWPHAQAVPWVVKRRAMGVDPTIYCNQMHDWLPIRNAFHAAKVPEPHYWVANYDRVIVIPPGAVAKQYTNPVYSGGHYDLSVVADYWPGVDEDDMARLDNDQFYRLLSSVYGLMLGPKGEVLRDASGNPIPTPAMKATLDAIAKIPGGTAPDLHTLAAEVAQEISKRLEA